MKCCFNPWGVYAQWNGQFELNIYGFIFICCRYSLRKLKEMMQFKENEEEKIATDIENSILNPVIF